MTETFICVRCGAEEPVSNRFCVGDEGLCEACADEETVLCSCCGERIWRDGNAGDGETPLCQTCYDRNYTNCSDCGRLLHLDDARYEGDDDEPLCPACYAHAQQDRAIQDYSYKPDPIFYGKGCRYFGVELEIDRAGELSGHAQRVLDIANGSGREHLYCKHDGLLDDGFELVTHPMTLKYHQTEMPWLSILNTALELGYQSHQAKTCGLHVHVNRDAFGDEEEEQDAAIARILYFFERHWEELLKFSRRTPRQLERWAARYGYQEQPRDILDHAKKGYHGGRYTCVNLQNDATIEFRMFRGTLKYNTLIATLQLVNRVCDVAICLSDEELKAMPWTSFVSGCQEPELIQYLKERRLYVNEPVEAEVEP